MDAWVLGLSALFGLAVVEWAHARRLRRVAEGRAEFMRGRGAT